MTSVLFLAVVEIEIKFVIPSFSSYFNFCALVNSYYVSKIFWYKAYWGSFAVILAFLSNLFVHGLFTFRVLPVYQVDVAAF